MKILVAVKGGEGSGNWGHVGRPGLVGGSGGGASGVPVPTSKQLGDLNASFLQMFEAMENPYYTKVEDINTGYCYEWAWIAHEKFGSELWFNENFSHAFVRHGELFFDAGTKKGVSDWIDLKGLREVRRGLVSLREHGRDRAVEMSEEKFAKLPGFNMSDVSEVMKYIR